MTTSNRSNSITFTTSGRARGHCVGHRHASLIAAPRGLPRAASPSSATSTLAAACLHRYRHGLPSDPLRSARVGL